MAENKYQRGKIYKIISPNTDKIYIGSTTEPTLACRLRNHRQCYRNYEGGAGYTASFAIIEAGEESIILLEAFPCNSRDELRAREQHHIDLNAAIAVNKHRAFQTDEGTRQAQNEKHICECGGKYTHVNQAKHNRTERHQNYFAGIPPAIVLARSAKFDCACGGKYTHGNTIKHNKTKRHQQYLEAHAAPAL